MIIYFAKGRLGNQIFQYVFLKSIQKKNEKMILSGFEDLIDVFDIDLLNINKKVFYKRQFIKILAIPVCNFLSEVRIISGIKVKYHYILETYKRETLRYTSKQGFFKTITYVRQAFFQSYRFFRPEVVKKLQIREKYISQAKEFMNKIPEPYNKVFIHIRRGDYDDFKVFGKSTLLPMVYFHDQISWFEGNVENNFYIFLSDEPDFIKTEFEYLDNKVISFYDNFGVDFAIMTLCNSAILSPSSFGWWGSYFMKNKVKIFAPKYWLGFNSKIEYQEELVPPFVEEVTISC